MRKNLEFRSSYFYDDPGMGSTLTMNPGLSDQIFNPSLKKVLNEKPVPGVFKNEFAVATAMSKTIGIALDDQLRAIAEPYTSKRLSSVINKNFTFDNGSLSLRKSGSELVGFEFDTSNRLIKNANINYCIRQGAQKGCQIIHIPAFIPAKVLKIPTGATNFKFCSRLIALSDCQPQSTGYDPVYGQENGKFAVYDSPMLPLLRIPTQPLTGQLVIPEVGYMQAFVTTLLIVAVKFYNYDHSKFTYLPQGSLMKIANIF